VPPLHRWANDVRQLKFKLLIGTGLQIAREIRDLKMCGGRPSIRSAISFAAWTGPGPSEHRAGISETVIMTIRGWRTGSVFERYAIVNRNDMADAILKLEQKEKQILHGHDLVTLGRETPTGATSNVGAQARLSTIASAN